MNTNPLDTRTLEAGVIGSILIDPERCVPLIMDKITAQDFGDPSLRHIWEAIWSLYTELQPIDAVTVAARCGAAYEPRLAEIIRDTPTSWNAETYTEMLQEGSRLRRLRDAAGQILYAQDLKTALAAVGELNGMVLGFPGRRAATWAEMLQGYLDRQSDKHPPEFLRWGFEQIDDIAPLRTGRFAVIGADSSVGKTAFAMQAAYYIAAHQGKRVAFYSYETSIEDSADRIVANSVNVALPRSKHKTLTATDYAAVMAEGDKAGKIPLEVVETAGYTTDQLRAEIVAHRVEVAFIDYVQLIPGDEDNRWETVTRTSMELHVMAQQLGCTIVALSQVTLPQGKQGGKRPTIDKHSLRESRQLTNDADLILLLDLADPDFPTGPRVLKVAKNKDGPLGAMYLSFDAEHMRFKPGLPPMPTGAPIPSKEELAADEARRNEKKPKPKPDKIAGQGSFEDLPDDGEPTPFEEASRW